LFVFLNSLKEIGVNPHVYRASEMYKNGEYTEAIQIALENTDKIRTIIETISKRKLPKNWLPFNILCEKCGQISAAKPILYEYPIIEYICDCGYEGEVDIRKGGVGKLPWRVDWPARWKMLGVTFEPCGKTRYWCKNCGRNLQLPSPSTTCIRIYPFEGKRSNA